MKKSIIYIAFSLFAISSPAQSQLQIMKSGETIDFEGNKGVLPSTIIGTESVDGIDKITFSGETMTIHRDGATTDYDVKEIEKVSVSGNINKMPIFYPPTISMLLNFEPGTDLTLDSDYAKGRYMEPFDAAQTVEINLSEADGLTFNPSEPVQYILRGDGGDKVLNIKAEAAVMILLDGVQMSAGGPSILIENTANTVVATAEGSLNTISGIASTGSGALTLCGKGSLRILSTLDHTAAIRATSDINVTGGTLNIAASGYCGQGIYSDMNVAISKAAVNILTTGDGTQEDDKLGFDCSAAVCAGIAGEKKNGYITLTDCKIRIKTTGGTGASGLAAMHHIKGYNSTIVIATFDDGFNAVDGVETNDCNVFSTSAVDDGVDSNGALIFRGGTMYVCGPYPKEGAFDNDGKNFAIERDITLIAMGAKSDTPMASKSTVPTIALKSVKLKRYVSIRTKQGGEVVTFITPAYPGKGTFVVATPGLEPKTEYDIFTADHCTSGIESWGMIKQAEFSDIELHSTVMSSGVK